MEWETNFRETPEDEDYEWIETFSIKGITINIKKCTKRFMHRHNCDKMYRTYCHGEHWRIQLDISLPEEVISQDERKRKFFTDDYGACFEFAEIIKKEVEERLG